MRRVPGPVLIAVPIIALIVVFLIILDTHDIPSNELARKGCLAPDVIKILLAVGLDGQSISPDWEAGDCPDLKVKLSAELYSKIGPLLEKTLAGANINVLAQEETTADRGAGRYRWRLQGPGLARLDAVFEIPERPRRAETRKRTQTAIAAIIVDDLGYSTEVIESLCALGRPVTVSILPFTPRAEEVAKRAAACGLETMLHVPLESLNNQSNGPSPVPGTIMANLGTEDIRRAVENVLDQVPGCRGVNNHAGSKFTEEAAAVRPLLDVLKARGLYFVDSWTSGKSVAYAQAVQMGISAAKRRIFLDADPEEDGVRRGIEQLLTYAKAYGKAVGICHPKKETIAALARYLSLADQAGVTLVFASAIVD